MSTRNVLEVTNLSVAYGKVEAVSGVSLSVGEGKIVTAGAVDTHIHFISPGQIEAALDNGTTTLVGGGSGPASVPPPTSSAGRIWIDWWSSSAMSLPPRPRTALPHSTSAPAWPPPWQRSTRSLMSRTPWRCGAPRPTPTASPGGHGPIGADRLR